MHFRSLTFLFGVTAVSLPAISLAQDLQHLGGDLTSDRPVKFALELPAPNIGSQEKIDYHLAGHEDFHKSLAFKKIDGKIILGPYFNHNTCGKCHVRNGRGAVRFSEHTGSPMLVKVALKGLNRDRSPKNVPGVGEQLQDHSVDGSSRFDIELGWKYIRGNYRDGSPYELRKPDLKFEVPGYRQDQLAQSIRITPPVIGMGLLEAVSDTDIEAMADPSDADGDGISGRVSRVPNRLTKTTAIGRFGFKASQPTLRQQSAAAFFNDMGLTNPLFRIKGKRVEIEDATLDRLVYYLRAAGVTPARNQTDPNVIAGKEIFQRLDCHGCHKMTLSTSASETEETAYQTFHPFTDLLLHDMGPDLADTRPEYSAKASEWRTTPLWGIGLVGILSKNQPGFLHDGRARTLAEAILWHGGEARRARNAFRGLSRTERAQLITFLKSL
jgi:CxxC motif-containing protein (DUF1111 family)